MKHAPTLAILALALLAPASAAAYTPAEQLHVDQLEASNQRLRTQLAAARKPNLFRVKVWLRSFTDAQLFAVVGAAYRQTDTGCEPYDSYTYDASIYEGGTYTQYTFSQSTCY